MMCPTFIGSISQVSLVKSQLLASLFDSNNNRNGHTNHRGYFASRTSCISLATV